MSPSSDPKAGGGKSSGAKESLANPVRPTAATTRLVGRPRNEIRRVELVRGGGVLTNDQALWTAIRTSTDAMNFNAYAAFIDRVFCRERPSNEIEGDLLQRTRHPHAFFGVEAYKLLKAATEAFLVLHCGVVIRDECGRPFPGNSYVNKERQAEAKRHDGSPDPDDPVTDIAGLDEATRVGEPWTYGEAFDALSKYLGLNGTLPYLDRIVAALFPGATPETAQGNPFCADILARRWTCPCLVELIWSFWHEEGMLVQTISAIALRFQNRRHPGARDPFAHLKLDPLRALSNLIFGYIQDEPHRLSLARRVYEYDHEYGLTLVGRAVPVTNSVESRSQFLEAYHSLLHVASRFFREDDDKTVDADGFPVLNALKEVHLILAQGAHNQFGDLPFTARVEMLLQKYLLSRNEIREYLGSAPMMPYNEPWMGPVDTAKALQGWSDVSVTHFRDMAVFGEQIILSVRWGDWSNVNNPDQARNWARYWRPEIQSYIHSYRAVTGVDLAAEVTDVRAANIRHAQPSLLHLQRIQAPRAPLNGSPEPFGRHRLTRV